VNKLVLLEDAVIEWQNSVDWYEAQSPGLGIQFAEVIEKKLNFREAIVNVFPFSIIFEFNSKNREVIITSIFHNKRSPKGKFKRKKP
jgi:hypothetical protein